MSVLYCPQVAMVRTAASKWAEKLREKMTKRVAVFKLHLILCYKSFLYVFQKNEVRYWWPKLWHWIIGALQAFCVMGIWRRSWSSSTRCTFYRVSAKKKKKKKPTALVMSLACTDWHKAMVLCQEVTSEQEEPDSAFEATQYFFEDITPETSVGKRFATVNTAHEHFSFVFP